MFQLQQGGGIIPNIANQNKETCTHLCQKNCEANGTPLKELESPIGVHFAIVCCIQLQSKPGCASTIWGLKMKGDIICVS